MTPDRGAAAAFIKALTGSSDTAITWQMIKDDRRAKHFAADYHLSLDGIWRELCYQNARGVGVFAMVNAGDGRGRKADHVVALRALFIDDDEGRLSPAASPFSSMPPSFHVRSKRGFHHYWLLNPAEPLASFSPAQVALAAHFGTDPAVKDLPRVMRVPGFFHMKDPANPFMVEFVEGSMKHHPLAEILQAYPAPTGAARRPLELTVEQPQAQPSPRRQGDHRRSVEAAATLAAFRGLRVVRWAMQEAEQVTREAWRGIATNIAATVLEHDDLHQAGADLFHEISRCDPARYSARDTDRTFRDALKSAREYGPMTFATLAAAGVPDEICATGAGLAKAPVGVARLLSLRVGGASGRLRSPRV